MGLLDDAIREHLELKRRHGADPEEVQREEQEALGAPPAEEAQEPAAPAAEAPDDATTVLPPPGEPATAEHEPPPPPPPAADEVDPPAGEEEVPRQGHEAEAPGYDEDPWLDVDEDEPGSEQPAAEEDVLEETPEFLQETPEHDRLWFEQKPPRDFDWDR